MSVVLLLVLLLMGRRRKARARTLKHWPEQTESSAH